MNQIHIVNLALHANGRCCFGDDPPRSRACNDVENGGHPSIIEAIGSLLFTKHLLRQKNALDG